ncbi:hypothetical protein [Microbacterium sp. TPD7012]|uniref:hypothetical protein n=1 Tax=Microbacterium sp. TPD7012 TaxID=2171975 RepID=UPI000D50C78F|nr:hypothetical protein [Microbacterium sp. TPD7012]PVE94993.1 hypothetical protein DC434_13795 [Microbacterium sp. TPD7012]
MAEVIIAPDAEGRAVAYLKARFTALGDSAKVGTKFPATGSSRFVRVVRAGGVSELAYDHPRLVFICSGSSSVTAERLCSLTRALVLAWARLSDDVTRVQDAGDMAYVPDPDSGQDRYQFAVQVDMKMSAI